VEDQAIVFIGSEELRYRLFDFRIWKFYGYVLRYMPVEHQKVVKLSEGPDTGLPDVYRGVFVVGHKINQMPVRNLFNITDFLRFKVSFEFI
jgi:hypothetical protein